MVGLGRGHSFHHTCGHKGTFIAPFVIICMGGGHKSGVELNVATNGGVNGTIGHGHTGHIVATTFHSTLPRVSVNCSFMVITEAQVLGIGDASMLVRLGGTLRTTNMLGRGGRGGSSGTC